MRVCLDPHPSALLVQCRFELEQEMTMNRPHAYTGLCACHPGASRRGFLQSLAGLGAAGALGASGCASLATPAKAHRIDVHHHLSPPAWVSALKKAKLDTPPVTNWSPQKSLDDMDQAGIATSMTSPTLPAVGFLNAADAAAVARASNEYARQLADQYPGRFGVFALLPMPHVDATLREIEYALDVLKADGVAFMTSYGDKFLGDPAFAPVMDELHRRKVTAYTHPNEPACCRNLNTGVPSVIIEYGTDTTRTISSLIYSGTAQRCPNINFIFSHAGGTIGALTERFNTQAVRLPDLKQRGFDYDVVMGLLKRFYYDTAQASNPIAMGALTKLVDVKQIVFGTDYPYRTGLEHVQGLSKVFGAADLQAIERDNALRILPARWRT
jgi:predicted TIM-barrel fold metal-dependent hydrolase